MPSDRSRRLYERVDRSDMPRRQKRNPVAAEKRNAEIFDFMKNLMSFPDGGSKPADTQPAEHKLLHKTTVKHEHWHARAGSTTGGQSAVQPAVQYGVQPTMELPANKLCNQHTNEFKN